MSLQNTDAPPHRPAAPSSSLGWAVGTTLLLTTAIVSQAAPPLRPKHAATPPGHALLSYNRDVRPILAENCFSCHGPDSASRQAGLRLDRFADAIAKRGGRPAIVPGDPIGSLIVQRILLPENDPLRMPPVAGHKSLSPEQKRTLLLWIEQGAKYEPHWSYIAPKRPALPAVKNAAWVRNPIDRFVLARLEQEGLSPAPEADKRTLIRRVTLDLTGLPPEPADVERFVKDQRPDAYERLVDKLLASPHWGEHRGRYWLDAARYADTNGIHFDNYREMWSYRDWVIQAFNSNMPFDRFTIEQLAGDLLPAPSLDQRIATGFNRCNITTNEGGAIDEEYRVLYTRDRTETASQVWLGQTAGCAVCHDHKFDPLSQKEFYSLAAFFNNTTQNAMDGNIKDTPPVVGVPKAEDRPRFAAVQHEIADARKAIEARKSVARADFNNWLADGTTAGQIASASVPTDGLRLRVPLNEGAGEEMGGTWDGAPLHLTAAKAPIWTDGHVAEKTFQRPANGAIEIPQAGDFEKDQPFTCAAWVKVGGSMSGSIMARMDDQHDYRGWDLWLEGNRVGMHIIHKWSEDALKVVSRESLQPGRWYHVSAAYDGGGKKESIKIFIDGVAQPTDVQADTLKSTIRTTVPLKIGQRNTTAGIDGSAIQDVRVYGRALAPDEAKGLANGTRIAYLASRAKTVSPAERDELFTWWLDARDEPYRTLAAKVTSLQDEERMIRQRGTVAHVSQEKDEAAMAFILYRGEYDKRREQVKPGTPAALPPMPAGFPRNRLGLAKWLLLPQNPLTTRVTVNRFWQEVFGQGLVRTTGDFGISGELPSHPELLDWMAVEFRTPASGGKPWDMKRFFKLMVTSATYRQASTLTPEKRKRDLQNRLLSRGPRFRMDAEMVRDYALSSSGLMVDKIGGPSVKTYQPDGVWEAVAMIGSNTRDYKRDSGDALYRRSLYTFWKRSAPPASLDIFNAPSRETCTVRRERTNTPLQALVTLNDVQYVEAARHLAERALKQGGATPATRSDYIARRLVSRPFQPKETAIVTRSLTALQKHYRAHPDDAKALIAVGESKADPSLKPEELAAWTMLTNQLMNLDEVLNK